MSNPKIDTRATEVEIVAMVDHAIAQLTADEASGFLEQLVSRLSASRRARRNQEAMDWLATRKKAGQKIDPETAKVFWKFAQVLDPYGVIELSEETDCIGRNWFARSSESDGWVWFGDLPEATREVLQKKIDAGLFNDDGLDWLFDD